MPELPHDVFALFVLAFSLGVKHGLDPDHLVTIDGLTRFNTSSKPWLSKWAGVIFSVGHGLVVTLAIAIFVLMPAHILIPDWVKEFGAIVSILILILLGVLNLRAALSNQKTLILPLGIKSWMYFKTGHPAVVLCIGAVFALSFDTLSYAAFFSFAASQMSIVHYASALGIVFTGGMIISDGVNGMLTARYLQQSAARALIASRVMSFAIGSISLLIAFIGIARLSMPGISERVENMGVWAGIIVLLWVTAGFVVSVLMSRMTERNS